MKTVRRLFVLNGTAYDGKDRIGKPTVPVLDRTNGTAKTNGTVRAINTNRPYLVNRPRFKWKLTKVANLEVQFCSFMQKNRLF